MPKDIDSKTIGRFSLLNGVLIAADLAVFVWIKGILPAKVPLFYSRPWGRDQLVPNIFLLAIPALSFVVLIVNWQISRLFLKSGDQFLATLNQSFSLLFTVLATITLWKIIFLIT